MQRFRYIGLWLLVGLLLPACNRSLPFADYQREVFDPTLVTQTTTHVIKLHNPSSDQPQHVRAIGFDAGGNPGGNFQLKSVVVGGRSVGQRDIAVPPGAALELHVTYAPRDLKVTRADFGGVETGMPTRFEPHAPVAPEPTAPAAVQVQQQLAGGHAAGASASDIIIQRGLLVLTYDIPGEGVMQVELIGRALPGPNGEIAVGGGNGTCRVDGTTACFAGHFQVALPGIVDQPQDTPLSGPWALQFDAGAVRADMAQFPVALFVITADTVPDLPLAAISIAISGDDTTIANGTFDGQALQLNGAAFRVRIFSAAETLDSIAGKAALIDFVIHDLTMITTSPLAGGEITLAVDTTLGATPTGNPLGDQLLANAQVKVTIIGTLSVP